MEEKNNESKVDNLLFFTKTEDEALNELETGKKGLSTEQAEKRLDKYGKNKLEEGGRSSLFSKLIEQFKNVMILVLIAAGVISGVLNEIADMIIILIVVILNAILGVIQENKAEKALEALKNMSAPYARVMRDGKIKEIKAENIVPGDIVYIEAGDYVPADLRLIKCASLKAEEAALTGESVPVLKKTDVITDEETVLGDRVNTAFMGSSITYGHGAGIAYATGMDTEMGKIAGFLARSEKEITPLQKKLGEISKFLTWAVLIIAAVIFTTGLIQGRELFKMFLTAVSLAVAAIPEGLPAVVTIVLAIGVQTMSKRNAIIRKLPAVETLGCTQVICSDKTGTLTQNKMTVKELYAGNKNIKADNFKAENPEELMLVNIMTLCNDTKLVEETEGINLVGDPTETALVDFANNHGFNKNKLDFKYNRISEIPFDSERKLMSTINNFEDENLVLVKGAPDMLINRCTHVMTNGKIRLIEKNDLNDIAEANSKMAEKALRVLAYAYKKIDNVPEIPESAAVEKDLIFIGLTGMIDPPRVEVKDAIKTCNMAGMKAIMITGDHKETAAAIALELGMIKDLTSVISGIELDKMTDDEFYENLDKYSVYARVSPENKVRIVKAWKKRGKVVAMTGDGVNDAPALKTSDIGVGMGITGTDVSKGVADMVLADDNFATIVIAVKEGRKIYSNIQRTIQFLLSCNIAEVFTLFVATLLGWDILLPIHILWINLVTDTFPALALGMEGPEPDIMKQKPRNASDNFFAGSMGTRIMYHGIWQSIIVIFIYYMGIQNYSPKTGITMAFMTLGLIQLAHAVNVRSFNTSLFKIGFFSNKFMLGAVGISMLLQVSVVSVPALNDIFKVEHLNLGQWGIVAAASILIIPIEEISKIIRNKARECKQ